MKCIECWAEIYSSLLLQSHEYYLGNGFKTTSPATAMDEFMKMEFKEILNSSEEPHDVIFIPDSFQYGTSGQKVRTICCHFLLQNNTFRSVCYYAQPLDKPN